MVPTTVEAILDATLPLAGQLGEVAAGATLPLAGLFCEGVAARDSAQAKNDNINPNTPAISGLLIVSSYPWANKGGQIDINISTAIVPDWP